MSNDDEMVLKKRKASQCFEISRILVGVAGGSAAGKTTLCEGIKREIQFDSSFDISIIALDSFYKGVDKSKVDIKQYNFDHPDSLDFDLAYQVLSSLLNGQPTNIPTYCFVNHARNTDSVRIPATQVIFFEGILALYDQRIRDLMQYKIFIHCDDDIRLCRRILRDVRERGREVQGILYQYNTFVKKSFEDYIRPTMNTADIIVPGSRSNKVAVSWIVHHLKNLCKQSGILKVSMDQLLYFGDLLYTFEQLFEEIPNGTAQSMLEHHSTPYRKIIFPTQDYMKQQLTSMISFISSNYPFDQKQLYFGIKVFLHIRTVLFPFRISRNSLYYTGISIDKIQTINLLDIRLGNEESISDEKIQTLVVREYVVLVIPFLFIDSQSSIFGRQDKLLGEIQRGFATHHPKAKLIILSIFSSAKIVVSVNHGPNFKLLVNAFLVGRQHNFEQILSNCMQSMFFFEANSLYKKTDRFITKRQNINSAN